MHTPFFEIITCIGCHIHIGSVVLRTHVTNYVHLQTVVSVTYNVALYNLNKRVGLLQSGHHHYCIESNSTSPLYTSNYTHLELNNNDALFCQLFLFDRGLLVVRVVVTGCIVNNDCLRFDRGIVRIFLFVFFLSSMSV